MSVIGTFTPARDGGWTGAIRTLTINAKLRLVPDDNRVNENAPLFRVFTGQSRVGDAWAARSGGDTPKDYLRVRLDDSGLPERIMYLVAPCCLAQNPSESFGSSNARPASEQQSEEPCCRSGNGH